VPGSCENEQGQLPMKSIPLSLASGYMKRMAPSKQSNGSKGINFEKVKKMTCQERMEALLYSSLFDSISASLVVLNSIFIGLQTDHMARHVISETPQVFRIVDTVFCVLFTLELLLRLTVTRLSFFYGSGWKWNIFDLGLVSTQLLDEILSYASQGQESAMGGYNFSFMRVLRILRLIRIMRIIRILRLIGELRAIVSSIMGSLKSLMWTVALLFLLVYVFGVYFTQLILDHRLELRSEILAQGLSADEKSPNSEALEHLFGSLGASVLSLYQAITGGIDWADISAPLIDQISIFVGMIMAFYVAFGVLALLNVVTGVFVESALKSAKDDRDEYMMNHVRDLFKQADPDGTQVMDLEAFQAQLDHEPMQEFFKAIDVDISEAESVFRLLDSDDSGEIEMEEFLNGCLHLRGPAKAIELSVLMHETKVITRVVSDMEASMTRLLAELDHQVCGKSVLLHGSSKQSLGTRSGPPSKNPASIASSSNKLAGPDSPPSSPRKREGGVTFLETPKAPDEGALLPGLLGSDAH